MNQGPIYPATIDKTTPVTPEVRALWQSAYQRVSKKRWLALLWQIPIAIGTLAGLIVLTRYAPMIALTIFIVLFLTLIVLFVLLESTFDYSVSDDRRDARIEFQRRWNPVGATIKKGLKYYIEPATKGIGGCLEMIPRTLYGIAGFPFFGIVCIGMFFDQVVWLSEFKNIMQDHLDGDEEPKKKVVGGTRILPSIEPAGSTPNGDEESVSSQDLAISEVLGGSLLLHSDGCVATKSGVRFEPDSNFDNVDINGMKLIRKDVGLLRVHHEGKDYAFFFNGSSWSEV